MKPIARLPDMFVLDALANDIEDLDSIVRMLNSETALGWLSEWGRSFRREEVVEALSRLIVRGFVTVLILHSDRSGLQKLPAMTLPPLGYEEAYFSMTDRGRLLHSSWEPDLWDGGESTQLPSASE
jgi:hypothetical protein